MPPKKKQKTSHNHAESSTQPQAAASTSSSTAFTNTVKYPDLKPKILEKEIEECIICTDIPYNVICCPECQNGPFCKPCFEKWWEQNKTCPQCKQKVQRVPEVYKILQKIINRYAAQCGHEDCDHKGPLESVHAHMNSCDFQVIFCKHQGCTEVGKRIEVLQHELVCGFEEIRCTCGARVLRKDKQAHLQSSCPETELSCDDCKVTLKRKELPEHKLNHCSHRKILCGNADIGCPYTGMNENYVQDHQHNCPYNAVAHGMRKIMQRLEKQEETIAKLTHHLQVSLPRQLTKTVTFSLDFSKYKPGEQYVTEVFNEGWLQFQVVYHPKVRETKSVVYIKPLKFMQESSFLVAMTYTIDDFTATMLFKNSKTWGKSYNNSKMRERNGVEKLEFDMRIELLQIIQVGGSTEVITQSFEKWRKIRDAEDTIEHRICTRTIPNTIKQEQFNCQTCNIADLCLICAEECHAGHDLKKAEGKVVFVCNCATKTCKPLDYAKLLGALKE